MKLYLIKANAVFEAPTYTFLVEAKTEEEARAKAEKIVEKNYGGFEVYDSYLEKMFIYEIKGLEDIKKYLLLK